MTSITVLIADRVKVSRAACRGLLENETDIRVVGEAASGLDAAAAAEHLRPSVLLLDMGLTDAETPALLAVIRRKSPRTRVLLLAGSVPAARTLEALSHGARGYLEKRALSAFLPRAVRAVDAGEAWVPRKVVAKIMDRLFQLSVAA
jgi:DNA-binding NarL/FixJ family response regulator